MKLARTADLLLRIFNHFAPLADPSHPHSVDVAGPHRCWPFPFLDAVQERRVTHWIPDPGAKRRIKLSRGRVMVRQFGPTQKNISQDDGMVMNFIVGCKDKRNPAGSGPRA